jgi:PHD/YefM family antitoxin component YafN of YafNO toxin-antitoxin module
VFITDRGKPAHVLLSIEEYQRLVGQHRNIADALAMPGIADIAFEPPRMRIETPADFA